MLIILWGYTCGILVARAGVGYLQGSAFLLNENTSRICFWFLPSVTGPFQTDWV